MIGKKIDDRVLERFLLNELPGEQIKEINSRMEEDGDLKERVESLKESNRSILEQYPAETMVPQIMNRYRLEKLKNEKEAEIKKKVKRTPSWLKRSMIVSPALAAAIILLFIISPSRNGIIPGNDIPIGGTRIKGSHSLDMKKINLLVYRQINDEAEKLEEGVTANAGDLLQLAYTVPEEKYGVILSIDGNGVTTLHFPEQPGASTRLEKKKKILLKNSYELDDAPGFERFIFITSAQAIDVDSVMQGAKKLARDLERAVKDSIPIAGSDSSGTYEQVSFLVTKGEKK